MNSTANPATPFSVFSPAGVNTAKIPACPRCRRPLKRQMSIFAKGSRGKEEPAGDDMPPFDEAKMEKAMAMLAGEAEKINEDDPRQAAQLMRKLTDATGLSLGSGMEEALSRLEKGEDPDRIEAEMGDLLEGRGTLSSSRERERGGAGNRSPAWTKPSTTCEDRISLTTKTAFNIFGLYRSPCFSVRYQSFTVRVRTTFGFLTASARRMWRVGMVPAATAEKRRHLMRRMLFPLSACGARIGPGRRGARGRLSPPAKRSY